VTAHAVISASAEIVLQYFEVLKGVAANQVFWATVQAVPNISNDCDAFLFSVKQPKLLLELPDVGSHSPNDSVTYRKI